MRFEMSSIRSMLGLRFRDATTERPVTDGLRVNVRRADGTGGATQAVRTVSGAYVAQELAGLRAYERVPRDIPENIPEDPSDLNNENEEDRIIKEDYLVDIRDWRGRFVPVLLKVKLPYTPKQKFGGLYPVVDPPPEEQVGENRTPEPTVYLFSAVQRPVSSGQTVVYADLVEKTGGAWQPAAHAVVEVRHVPNADGSGGNGNQNGEEVWYGIADGEGRVAVQFPLPSVQLETLSGNGDGGEESNGADGGNGSGGSSDRRGGLSTLSGRSWPLVVRVFYDPSLSIPSRARRPTLRKILSQRSQDPAPIHKTTGSQSETLEPALTYGESLVLRTEGRSALRIAPSSNGS
jgi:hypothetical protein